MSNGLPVSITDDYGNQVRINAADGKVTLEASCLCLHFGAEDRERFAQAWVAACHVADRRQADGALAPAEPGAAPPSGPVPRNAGLL